MSTDAKWYQDDTQLLGTLKQTRRPDRGAPVIPGYDELRELTRGGQGIVFHALQKSTHRRVAIKVLLDGAWANEVRRRRFEREIELIAALHHPNIVRLYDSGLTDIGHPYYVMEYIEGVSLDKLIGGGALGGTVPLALSQAPPEALAEAPAAPDAGLTHILSLRTTLDLFGKVCDAVHYAHQHGVIHRDLKPSNVRVDPEGEPHVLDFGLAKAAPESGILELTDVSRTGEFMGSLPWASPEQAEGNPHGTDLRTDVYSLGVMLFQVLTGRFPYPIAGPFRQALDHIQKTPPLRPSTMRREIDDELETIILKCLAKEPDRRYQTAGELARDVRHYLAGEPIEAKRDSALYTLRKTMRRYRTAARVSAAFVLMAFGAAVFMSILWLHAKEAEQLAEQRREAADVANAAQLDARNRVEREAAQSLAINDFLVRMLAKPLDLGREARVADVLDEAAAELGQSQSLKPATEAALRRALGNAYSSLGLYDQAATQLQSAIALWQREFGADSPETLDGRSSLAWLRHQTGQLDDAERLFRKILETRRRVQGDRHLSTTQTMNDLAYVLEAQGKFEEAESLHRAALANMRRLLGDEALDTLTSMGNLASVLCSEGKMDEATALALERLETARRVLGGQHRDAIRAMSSYARLLGQSGQYEESTRLVREVFEAERRLLGDDHPETIIAEVNLGIGLSVLGQLADCEPLLRDGLARARRVLGPTHPDTLSALSSLATLLSARGAYDEAEALFREALAASAEARGEEHVDTLFFANGLARCLQSQGKHAEAEALFRTTVQSCVANLGAENPYTLTATLNLGSTLVDLRRFEEAEPLLHQVVDSRARLFGSDNIDTLNAKLQLAILFFERGDAAVALAELGPLLKSATATMPAGHWYPAIVQGWYGKSLQTLSRFEDAETELVASFTQLRAVFGDENPRTRKAGENLVALYTAWNRPADAERFRALLAPQKAAVTPESSPTAP